MASPVEKARLDLATGLFGFAKSLIDFPTTGALATAATETYNWLIRERIDEASFNACRDLAIGGAYPNSDGMQLQKSIDASDRKILDQVKKAPLRLVVSGSLGRLVGRNPELVYMVTTVAVLSWYHPPDFASELLCSMILDRGGHDQETRYRYEVRRAPLKAVISKVVESIFINVSNAGHSLPGLPAELRHLHKHLLDEDTFAGIIVGIRNTQGDVTIRSQRFLANLTLWLYFHFEGKFEVVLQDKVLLSEKRGSDTRRITLIIVELCNENSDAWHDGHGYVQASVFSGSSWRVYLQGTDGSCYRPCSHLRQPVYELDDLLSSAHAPRVALRHAELNSVIFAAKEVMRWLLDIPLDMANSLRGLNFRVMALRAAYDPQPNAMCLSDLFARQPQLLHLRTGEKASSGPRFKPPENEDDSSDMENTTGYQNSSPPMHNSELAKCFPVLQDALEDVRIRCSCPSCRRTLSLDACKPGCIRYAAWARFLLLLTHGICDALGASDVSGNVDYIDQMHKMVDLLRELIGQEIIRWDTVFAVAGSALAGVNVPDFDGSDGAVNGASVWAAVQCGSFVAAASWLDIKDSQTNRRPFELTILEGNIQGIPDDLGFLQCEIGSTNGHMRGEAMDLEEPERKGEDIEERSLAEGSDHSEPARILPNPIDQEDSSKAECYSTIFRSANYKYRLMTSIRSGSCLKTIDPGDVIRAHWTAGRPRCHHSKASEDIVALSHPIEVVDFDHALASWTDDRAAIRGPWVSKILTENLKLNVLASLSKGGCIIRRSDQCCISCAVDMATKEMSRFKKFKRILICNDGLDRRRQEKSRISAAHYIDNARDT